MYFFGSALDFRVCLTPNFPDCLATFQLPNAFNVYAVIVAESIAEIFNKIFLFSFWPCPNEKLFSIISAMHYK